MSLPPSIRKLRAQRPEVVAWLGRPARAVAFWIAIGLPAVYLPLFTVEVRWLPSWIVFVLLGVNVVALLVGHPHRQ
jgi:hypothetical protein